MHKGILLIICFILAIHLKATDTCKAMIQADFEVQDICLGNEAVFINTSASDSNESYYSWKFGDSTISIQRHPKHVYGSAQSYAVLLKVVLKNGCSDSMLKIVNINPLPATCDFDIFRDYNTSSTTYKFTPIGGIMAGISYTWLTGDGNTVTSSGAGASYSYSGIGKYCITMISRNVSGCECSKTKCIPTSYVKDVSNLTNLMNIFPNPTNGVFNIKLDAYVNNSMFVEIYNSIGEVVKTLTVDSNNVNIDLSNYTNGVYMVKVIADNQVATKQIILNN
ncbi:MAG: PKD domain-containing protein [Bacteroidota bacterium]